MNNESTPNTSEIVKDISLLYMWDYLPNDVREKFCKIDIEKGCSKFQECDIKGTNPNCYLRRPEWCKEFISERNKEQIPNPSGILIPKICKCDKDKIYRDCSPCPYYGCVIPGENELNCPFTKISGEKNRFRYQKLQRNPYTHIWCYITRKKFREYQRNNNLWAASFIYRDVLARDQEAYYLMKNPVAPIQFLSTHFNSSQKSWEPIEDEQLRWHVISSVRKKVGLKQFELIEEYKRLNEMEKSLGAIIVEDGEFSFFLLLWRLKRISEASAFEIEKINKKVSIKVVDAEKELFDSIRLLGLGDDFSMKWHEINNEKDYIDTSILDEFKILGLIKIKNKNSFEVTDRFEYLMYWLENFNPDLNNSVFEQKLNVDHTINIDLSTKIISSDNIQNLSSYILDIGENLDIKDIEAIARFPLVGHYYIRRGFFTPLHWIVFPIMYYEKNKRFTIFENKEKTKRIPIGLFIGLFYCPFAKFDKKFFLQTYQRWSPIINIIYPSTNQYFLENIIEKYNRKEMLALGIGAWAHELNNKTGVELVEAIKKLKASFPNKIEEIYQIEKTIKNLADSLNTRLSCLRGDHKKDYFDLNVILDELVNEYQNKCNFKIHENNCTIYGNKFYIKEVLKMRLNDAILNGDASFSVRKIKKNDNDDYLKIKIESLGLLPAKVIRFQSTGEYYPSSHGDRDAFGIPYCFKVIERHNGLINCNNIDSKNRCFFHIFLPVT